MSSWWGGITVGVGTNAIGGLNFLNSSYTLAATSAQAIDIKRGYTGSGGRTKLGAGTLTK